MERNKRLDLYKGVAILLVLIGHAIQGACNIADVDCFENVFFKIIYSFHMPLFMLISGYLYFYSYNKYKSASTIIAKRLKSFLPPIITLSLAIAIISLLIGKHNTPLNIFNTFVNDVFLWRFWFLWSIIINVTIVGMVMKYAKHPLCILLIIILITLFIPDNILLAEHKFVYPFFILGFVANFKKIPQRMSVNKWTWVSIFLLYIVLIFNFQKPYYIYTSGYCVLKDLWWQQLYFDIYRFVIALCGSIIVMQLLNYIHESLVVRICANIGKKTFGIYVLQMFAMNYIPAIPKLSSSLIILFLLVFLYLSVFSIAGTYVCEHNRILRLIILGKYNIKNKQ